MTHHPWVLPVSPWTPPARYALCLSNQRSVGGGVIDPDQIHEVAVFSRPYSAMWDRESLAAFKLALDVVKEGIRSTSRDGVDVLIHQA
jgi:hypothetical protein